MDFSALDPEQTLIITASRRQSRFLREQYAKHQLEQGLDVWQSLKVMPWSAFVNYCWELALENHHQLPIRLSQTQSQYIWQQMVAASDVTQSLLNSKQTQKLSQDAWRICQQWHIEHLEYLPGDQDQAAFEAWFQEYRQRLSDKNWVDSYQQPNVLIRSADAFIKQLPSTIITYGFQQPTPQQLSFFELLETHKNVARWQLQNLEESPTLKLYALPEPQQELLAAIRWARAKLNNNQEQTIAIVVPELEQWRGYIERLIQREFYAGSLIKGGETHQPLHDFSIDESLVQQPLVAIILDWLALTARSLTKQQLQNLLVSPYLYTEQEQHWHATELELLVRQSNKAYYSIDDLLKLSRRQQIKLSWLELAHQWKQQQGMPKGFQSHIADVLSLLVQLDWTGYHSLSSREYQVQQTLIENIKSAQSLQKVLAENVTYEQSINLLKHYLEQQSFHQQQPRAPLQIVGLLEAIGLNFDAAWLVGATDQTLPQKATPNPFLSKVLHRKHELPGSSHHREVEYAQSLLDSLLTNPELIISYAQFDGEQEQMMSPLLQPLMKQCSIEKLTLDNQLPEFIHQWRIGENLEFYEDNQGTAITDEFDIRGGTGLLRMQAASPFDAYLRYRLALEPFEVDGLGISFMERGNMFHKAMQMIWRKLQDQKSLLSLSHDEQQTLVNNTLDFVLSETQRHVYLLNNPSFYQIEKQRLGALVEESLELDKNRESFTVIGTEVPRALELAGLKFTIIIDRIDQLDDGRLLIIDYKTGQPTLVSLFRDPIAEPQLLLYAISEHREEQAVAGILFMQAHLKACKYIGMTDEADILPGVKALREIKYNPYAETFDEAIEQWREILEQIALDFKSGKVNLTEYSGDYAEHGVVSRWSQRDIDLKQMITGDQHD